MWRRLSGLISYYRSMSHEAIYRAISMKMNGVSSYPFTYILGEPKTLFEKLLMCYQSGRVVCTAVGCLQVACKVAACDKALIN